jgi:hypothetical protein
LWSKTAALKRLGEYLLNVRPESQRFPKWPCRTSINIF